MTLRGRYFKDWMKKILLNVSEIFKGGASTITTSTLSTCSPSAGIIISSSTALLNSIVILITNEYISKLKLRYFKLKDWIDIITLFCENSLNWIMVD